MQPLGVALGGSTTQKPAVPPKDQPHATATPAEAAHVHALAGSMATTSSSPSTAQPGTHTSTTAAINPSAPGVPSSESAHGSSSTAPGPPASAPVASQPSQPAAADAKAPTATVDPNVPSQQSGPTALPTNAETHPAEQAEAIKDEHPAVVAREVEKTKAEERELKGEKPQGTVVSGMEDDRLWAMLRRFDQQILHVLHPAAKTPANEPDLRPSSLPNLPSHSDAVKTNLERCIAAVGPSAVRGSRELMRLTSWSAEERVRTGTYAACYFTAWIFGYAVTALFLFGVVLIAFPGCRRYLFPPVPPPPFTPPSATDPTNKKGDESLLGSVDNTVVHRSKHEQAEEQAFEATAIIQGFTTRLLFDGRKKGKHAGNSEVGEKQHSDEYDSDNDETIDQDEAHRAKAGVHKEDAQNGEGTDAQGMQSAAVVVGGEKIIPHHELSEKERKRIAAREAKRKRDELVSKMIKQTELGLGAFADFTEMMTNALSPPIPYPDRFARFKIAGAILIPPMLLFHFVPAWVFGRATTFMFGVGMFAQPVLIKSGKVTIDFLNNKVPNWPELLDIRNSLMSGVPTDTQLTLHLLRVAEALGTPLPRPPPPPLAGTPKEAIKETTPATVTAEDELEVLEAEKEGGAEAMATKAKVKTKNHVLGALQNVTKKMAGFHGDVSVDGRRKKIGTQVDKLLFRGYVKDEGTMFSFPARLDKESGHIILENRNEDLQHPQISFVPISGKEQVFTLPIDDIVELKKAHVSMPRIALGWVSGADVEGLGLTLRFKTVEQQIAEAAGAEKIEGQTLHFTRVGRREQLFVRLVSMGRQRWEVL